MNNEEQIKNELYNKLQDEYDSFIEELKKESPEVILERSYEKVMKEELKDMFYPEYCNYDIKEIKALMKKDKPLEELYEGWMDFDGGIQEELRYSVEDTLEFIEKEQRKNKEKTVER